MFVTKPRVAMAVDENASFQQASKKLVVPDRGGMAVSRRTLGDIGNLVGSMSSSCSVKDVPVPVAAEWGAKQRRTKVVAAAAAVGAEKENVASRSQKPVLNVTVVPRKEPTLTAQLNAWSETVLDAEMTDAEEEALPNIDAADEGNPLAVVDYVEDIYSFYRKAEVQHCVFPDYMSLQPDLNFAMRAILIDWLIEVHYKFQLMPETLFLTTSLIDRYLCKQSVSRKYLQLVGVTGMLIASKYEEVWAPEVKDFVSICQDAYTSEQILDMEKKMLNALSFNLTVPTPYVFVVRFLKAASSDRQMDMLAFFLVELCLTESTMLKYRPSMLAAAAVYTAQCCLNKWPLWCTALQLHSGYTEEQLRECACRMAWFHQRASQGDLTVVYRKYSSSKFESVTRLHPAKLPHVA